MILDYMLANAPIALAALTAVAVVAAGVALAWRRLRGRQRP